MAAAPSRGACPPTSLSSTRLTRTSPSIRSWPLARRVWAAGAAQRVGPAGGGGVSCPHVHVHVALNLHCTVECCMCPLEGRQVVPGSGSRLRFLTQKQGGRQNPSLRFLMPEVLNAHPELYKVQIIELTREAAVTTQHGVPPFYVMSPPPSRAASWPVPTARAPRHQRCVGVL